METTENKSFPFGLLSAAFAFLTLIGSLIILFGLGEGLGGKLGNLLGYIFCDLTIVIACFFIVRHNPRSIWYAPIIANLVGLLAAIIEPDFWKTDMWYLNGVGWLLTIFVSVIAFRIGNRASDDKVKIKAYPFSKVGKPFDSI